MHNTTAVSSAPSPNAYNTSVFWGVNAVIFSLAIILMLWGMCGNNWLLRWSCCTRQQQQQAEEQARQEAEQRQQIRREQEEKNVQRDTPEQRRQKLEECFLKHNTIMTVTADDVVEETQVEEYLAMESLEQGKSQQHMDTVEGILSSAQDADDVESLATAEGDGYLMLSCDPPTRRHVPNCCAVCLSRYKVDDAVVWSPNETCQHAFHQDCILEWLVVKMYKQRGLEMTQHNPCPCCRQEFAILKSTSLDP